VPIIIFETPTSRTNPAVRLNFLQGLQPIVSFFSLAYILVLSFFFLVCMAF